MYDVVIVGTGQATGTVVAELTRLDMKVAVVESDRVGGTCTNWGCTPTKTLVASARAAHMARRGADFGVNTSNLTIDFDKVMARVNGMRNSVSDGMASWLKDVTDFRRGQASFVDDHTIQVGNEKLRADRIVVHTGTRARKPDVPGIDTVPWIDTKGILALKSVPKHLLVVGGSYVGLEFAQAFRRLGSEVTVIQRGDRIISHEDPDVSQIAMEILADEGIKFYLNAELVRLENVDAGVAVHVLHDKEPMTLTGSHVLVAVGRQPNSDTLNLSAAGVETNSRGFIEVNDVGQTNVPHIYALGDVNGRSAFTHTSVHDGQVFLEHLAGLPKKISDRIPIYSMYIDPPLARVGMSVEEARRSGEEILVATRNMNMINRALEKDETNGIIKLLVEKESKLIKGATVFGVGGDEIIGLLALAMQAGIEYTKLQDTVFPPPHGFRTHSVDLRKFGRVAFIGTRPYLTSKWQHP